MIHAFIRRATLALLAVSGVAAHAAPCPTTAFTPTTSLPAATVGVPYSQALGASNVSNAVPFTFAVTGGLPSGSGLAVAATGPASASFAGTPTQVGNHVITLAATDAVGCSGGRSYALAIGQGSQTISFTSAAPATATIGGAAYTVTATATSGLAPTFSIAASSSSVCTIAGSTVSFIGAGTCVVNANQAGNANYAAAPQVQQSFGVGLASQTISFTSTAPTTAVVGGAGYTVTATASSGLAVAFSVDASASAVCSISGSTVSFTAVGSCVVNANQAGNASFNAAPQVQQSFAVGKGNQTISFTSTAPSNAVVAGATYSVAATATSGLAPSFSVDASASAVCSISGSTVSFTAVGSCVINANQAGNANYNAAPQAQQSFAVGKGSQTINFTSTPPIAATFGGASYTVTATASSGLAVTFAIVAGSSSVCSISGSTVSFIGVGSCEINASQAGNVNYNPAPPLQQVFAVGKADQSINFTSTPPIAATVGGASYSVTATASSGLAATFSIAVGSSSVCSISGSTVSFIGVGACEINASQAGNANYNAAPQLQQVFAVGKGNQTITFTSKAPAAAMVAGATYSVTATSTSGLAATFSVDGSASAVCTISGSTVSFIGVGSCVINANQAGNANYNAAPQVQQSFAVGKGNQTISFTSTAPSNAVVAGATYTVTATASSGLAPAFTVDATASAVCAISGSTVSFIAVGTCVINANQAGNANYNAAPQVQQSFAVGPGAQTITFTSTAPANAMVNGAGYTVAATSTAGLTVSFTIAAGASSVCTISGAAVSFIGAGTCVINANQAGNANYNAAPQAQQSFTVGKGAQTITFTSTAPTNAQIGGTYAVTATATSALAVSFTIDASASAVCSIAGSTVTFTAGGSCVVNANQAGDSNWNPAAQVQQSFTVSACISMAVGQVVLATMPGGADFCVANSAAADAEYTYLPINNSQTTNTTLSLVGTNIVGVTGPPTPRPEDVGGLQLAPLAESEAAITPVRDAETIAHSGSPFPAGRAITAADLIEPNGTVVVPLTVGQLIDLNASVGACGIANDIRKGRVEAVTTAQSPGQQRLYAVQEVVENMPGSGVWVPAVAGGAFPAQDFQNIVDAIVQAAPGSTAAGSGTLGSLLKTGALDIATANFGALTDLDNNGGVIVFYTRKLNELSPPASSSFTAGLFQPRDLFSAATCGGSNQGEIFYMAVPDPTGAVNSNVRTQSFVYGQAGPTLVHHMEHLFNATRRLYFNGAEALEETWLDEALAWYMQELVFFNTSVGITPRSNIQLSTLTTGPNASVRVAAFNTYANPLFQNTRGFFYQLSSTNGLRRAGPLRSLPITTSPVITTLHELIASNYTVSHMFLRYAIDRKNTGDAAITQALVNSSQTGLANLQAALGVNLDHWARDFLVAAYTDDAVPVSSEYTLPSWNYRSVYGGLGGFPLTTSPLTNATAANFNLGTGGGTIYARFGVAAGQSATLVLTEGGTSPTAPLTTAIVRTK